MKTPTIAIAHGGGADDAVSRLTWLAADFEWPLSVATGSDFSVDEVEPVIAGVGQGSPLLLVHFLHFDDVGPAAEAQDTMDRVGSVAAEITAAFPGIDLRSWAIVLTGRLLDPLEQEMINALTPKMRGVIVTAASTNTTVAHSSVEEVAFAADMAVVLGTSDLEAEIGGVGGAWMCGISSATYSTRRLRLAVAALGIIGSIDELLAPGQEDVAYELGEQWLDDLQLGDEPSWRKLLDSPAGGSLLSKVRLFDIDFDEVPVEFWSEAITTRFDLITLNDVPFIEERLSVVRRERFDELRSLIGDEILTQFEETANLAEVAAYCRGMRSALDLAISSVEGYRPPLIEYDEAEDRRKLRDLLRWLPFGPAVAVRLVMVALATLVGLAAILGSSDVPVDLTDSIWPIVAGAAALIIGWGLYRRRLRRTIRVRDRLAHGIEEQLVASVERTAIEEQVALLKQLRTWLGEAPDPKASPDDDDVPETAETIADWLWWLRVRLEGCRPEFDARSTTRTFGVVGASKYAIDVPGSETVETASLIGEDGTADADMRLRLLVALIRDAVLSGSLTIPSRDRIVSTWSDSLVGDEPLRWESIADVLGESDRAAESVRAVLATDLTPTGGLNADVRHYLVVPDAATGTLLVPGDDATAPGVMARLTDTRSTLVPRFAAMVHLYELASEIREGAL